MLPMQVSMAQMDPECMKTVREQPEEHRATMPEGPDPKCVRKSPLLSVSFS